MANDTKFKLPIALVPTIKPHPFYLDEILIGGTSLPFDVALEYARQIGRAVRDQRHRKARADAQRESAQAVVAETSQSRATSVL